MNRMTGCAAIALLAFTNLACADEASIRALEQACEAAREVKLKPLRDAEIARCKTESHSEADYCERFWSDYGNAKRLPNGTMEPRMFDDLPECIAAQDARRKLK